MKKIIIALVMALIFSVNAYGYDINQVKATGAVLMDMDSGRVLWGKNEEEPLAMASTTKIMTAVLALEMGNEDDIVTVSQRAASAPEVDIDLSSGEEIRLEYLLYALMLKSANDAAVAIAEHIGGSVEGFAVLMNDRAFELGAYDTNFVTPNGLDEGDHHSTAKDMATIAAYALRNERFVEIINTADISFSSEEGRSYSLTNKNRLLREFDGAFGVKTGFTCKAGHCFVGAAEKNGVRLVSTVLASGWGNSGKEYKWSDTKAILSYGFENYKYHTLLEEGTPMGSVEVLGSETKNIELKTVGGIAAVLNDEEKNRVEKIIILPEKINAPVREGQRVGFIRLYLDDFLLGETDIIAMTSAEEKTFKASAEKLLRKWING